MTCYGITMPVIQNCIGITASETYKLPLIFTLVGLLYLFIRSLPIISPIISAIFGYWDVLAVLIVGILLWAGVYYGLKFVDWIKDPMNAALVGAGIIVFSVFLYVLKQPKKKKKTRRK